MGNQNFILEHSHHLFGPKWDSSKLKTFLKVKTKILLEELF
jgi:hypothetical protein